MLFFVIGRLLFLDVMGKNIYFIFFFFFEICFSSILVIVLIIINKGDKIFMELKFVIILIIYGMIFYCYNVKVCVV